MKGSRKTNAAVARAVSLNAALTALSLAPYAQADDGGFKHDRIVEANASLFTQGYFSEELSGYAVGYKDPNNIEETLGFFAPEVMVPRRFEYASISNAEEFYSDTDDLRAIRGSFPEVEYTESKVQAKTENRGLKICIDLDEVADKENWREHYTGKLLRRIYRNSLRRSIALLSAAATNTAVTWDATAGKDPDADINDAILLGTTASGIRPNRVGYGDTAWSKRVKSHRAQDNAGGYSSAGMKPAEVAAFLNVDEVKVSRERYSTGGAKAEVLNNLVLMFMALEGADPEDPSNIKRFISPCEGGGRNKVYERQVTEKLYEIVVEHYELTAITATLGIRKNTVS
jgi:hypothetical protein